MTKQRVTGIGGIFFRAKEPSALARWYSDNLGVDVVPSDYDTVPWQTQAGTTVFAPFSSDTDYFGRDEQTWMINFRVADMDAMILQLEAAGIDVKLDPDAQPNGRFARLYDPEGNPIELWEPA
ncbi:MAG: VOC family protein [Hyphomicrobiales bacterium]